MHWNTTAFERKHQHLLNVTRSLRFKSGLEIKYWSYCILTAVHLINRIPTPIIDYKTPYEMLFKLKPSYKYLRVFGCLVFSSTLANGRHKFDLRGRTCVLLGYPFRTKGYKLKDLETKQIFVSRNVVFHEDISPSKLVWMFLHEKTQVTQTNNT